jgi:hypothetical protein
MLENCLSGSEGGGAVALPTPIIGPNAWSLGDPWTRLKKASGLGVTVLKAEQHSIACIGFQPVWSRPGASSRKMCAGKSIGLARHLGNSQASTPIYTAITFST